MDKKISAAITAIGGYVPEYRLTNAELETMVETNDEWIKSRTGVEERRILKGRIKAFLKWVPLLYWSFVKKEELILQKLIVSFVALLRPI